MSYYPDESRLTGKPVILSATGGSDRHALMIEHQLRPFFHYLKTATVATTIDASRSDHVDQDSEIQQRISRAVDELSPLLSYQKELLKRG